MKETRFISQNKDKWLESEMLLKDKDKDPEKFSNLFTQVMDDLSYSRTHYPNRSVRVYLNKIGREYFSMISDHKKEKKNRFASFWLDEIPQIMLYARKEMVISVLIFVISAAIGIFSSIKDPHFTSTILGDGYVAMTKENISTGDPMAVYKKSHQVDMFLGITVNNLYVAFRTYVFGVFFSIGSIGILIYNGIMVGCFQFFFIERGLFVESALTIWLHGTLEISSIVLAGGAGLMLGSGLVFPGTYTRIQSFQISAIRSLKLMLGLAPIFVLAAIIESFITRYTDMPDVIKLILILLSATFIIGYFVIYPWLKSKKGFEHPLEEVRIAPAARQAITFDKIKTNAEILKDTFQLYGRTSGKFLPAITIVSALMTIANMILTSDRIDLSNYMPWYTTLFPNLFFALEVSRPEFIGINAIGSGIILHRIFSLIDRDAKSESRNNFSLLSLGQIIFFCGVMYLMLYALNGWGVFLLIALFVIFVLIVFIQHTDRTNLVIGISRSMPLVGSNFSQVVGLQAVLLLMTVSFLLVLSSPLLYFKLEVLEWNFAKNDEWAKAIISFVEIFIKVFAFNLVLPVIAASVSYLYFSLREISTAENLKLAISQVGTKQARR